MVQERDLQPRKIHHGDLDRIPVEQDRVPFDRSIEPPRPRIISPPSPQPESRVITDMASGLALLLALISFFFSSYAVIQAVNTRRTVESLQAPDRNATPGTSFQQQSFPERSDSFAEPSSRPIFPFVLPYRFQQVEPGEFIQPVLDGAAEVELLSVSRVSPTSNLVNLEMRVRRLSNPLESPEALNLNDTIARNTRTNEKFVTQSSTATENSSISLDRLRPGQSIDATVTLRIPTDLDRVDLEIPATRAFRRVPIS